MDGDVPNEHAELDANEQSAFNTTLSRIDHEADVSSNAVVVSRGVLHFHTTYFYCAVHSCELPLPPVNLSLQKFKANYCTLVIILY